MKAKIQKNFARFLFWLMKKTLKVELIKSYKGLVTSVEGDKAFVSLCEVDENGEYGDFLYGAYSYHLMKSCGVDKLGFFWFRVYKIQDLLNYDEITNREPDRFSEEESLACEREENPLP